MRSAILELPQTALSRERRQVFSAAMRQLDRAEIYLAAVAYMELDDRDARRALNQLRTDVGSLRRNLGESRERITG